MANSASIPLESVTATLPGALSIAVIGNPNAGKSTLFNQLTGLRQKTANFPGVTVEKHVGRVVLDGRNFDLVDLPGVFSLSPQSLDEHVAVDALFGRIENTPAPDAILCILDATRLYQGLFLAQQLIETGCPLVVALTMTDAASATGVAIDTDALRRFLRGVPVVPVVATSGSGLPELRRVLSTLGTTANERAPSYWTPLRESAQRLHARLPQPASAGIAEVERAIIDSGTSAAERIAETLGSDGAALLQAAREEICGAEDSIASEARHRYGLIRAALGSLQHRAPVLQRWRDRLLRRCNEPVPASILFFAVMALIFQAVFAWATPLMDGIDSATAALGGAVASVVPEGVVQSLLIDGIIAGVGSVVIFLPQICILFLFIILLEDTGYLARAAFLVDRAMRSLGLSGQSVIPLLSGFACAVPGIMATRVIPDRRDRLATILAAPFMTCSARLPVYALLIAAFIPARQVGWFNLQGLVLLGLYLLGIAGGVLTAFLLKRLLMRGPTPSFSLALPDFRIPNLRTVLMKLLDRAAVFLKRAGTVIFTVAIIVWALAYFPRADSIQEWQQTATVSAEQSLEGAALEARLAEIENDAAARQLQQSWLGRAGQAVEPVFRPLGWDWRVAAAVIAGFPAREVVVAVLGTIYAVGPEADEASLADRLKSSRWPDGSVVFTLPMVLGLLVFYAWCLQCGATLAIMRRETGTWAWPIGSWTYMTTMGYLGALAVYQLMPA
ncbi:MAG: ferrous iron transport protein B [Gammaproteobacteria bacterium]|nr:ferrous iron transport protein B [Gammaproteobacteria bacterium]